MTSTITEPPLTSVHAKAADYLRDHGWTQGDAQDTRGRVDLIGALRHSATRPGDWAIAAAVYRASGHGEDWNDHPDRTFRDVHACLASNPVTDADLARTFGPQWPHAVTFVRRAAAFTPSEHVRLRDHLIVEARDREAKANALVARARALQALIESPIADRYLAGNAAAECTTTDNAPTRAALSAIYHRTALALTARHLIGASVFTEADYATLTTPWRDVAGSLHPQDPA